MSKINYRRGEDRHFIRRVRRNPRTTDRYWRDGIGRPQPESWEVQLWRRWQDVAVFRQDDEANAVLPVRCPNGGVTVWMKGRKLELRPH